MAGIETLPLRPVSVDTEFIPHDDGTQTVVCIVAKDLWTGEVFRRFADELGSQPFYPHGPDTVMVAHNAAAELESYTALGWPLPENIICTMAEHLRVTNGRPSEKMRRVPIAGRGGLLAALRAHGLPARQNEGKRRVIAKILRGPPYSAEERAEILDYCQEDVDDAERLLTAILPQMEENWFTAALVRGDYSRALAEFNRNGHPVDVDLHDEIIAQWDGIRAAVTDSVSDYGVHRDGKFRHDLFEDLLHRENAAFAWPYTAGGSMRSLAEKTLREMGSMFPRLERFCSAQISLTQMKNIQPLAIGPDGRVRVGKRDLAFRRIGQPITDLSDGRLKSAGWGAYRAKTGRNQPGSREFLMLRNNWWRTLLTPEPGKVLLYCDWSSQEIGIAAFLSGDKNMAADYEGDEDFYLAFAKSARLVPPDATKKSHKQYRDKVLKAVCLGTLYGQQKYSMAARIKRPVAEAGDLLLLHAQRYSTFWRWSSDTIDTAFLRNQIETPLGWQMEVGDVRSGADIAAPGDTGVTTLQNWPMQATGADILRVAATAVAKAGLRLSFPLHDALLIECAECEAEDVSRVAVDLMVRASEVVLGRPIPVDVDVIRYGQNLRDGRGDPLWNVVRQALGREAQVA